jgi:hypothetical protein
VAHRGTGEGSAQSTTARSTRSTPAEGVGQLTTTYGVLRAFLLADGKRSPSVRSFGVRTRLTIYTINVGGGGRVKVTKAAPLPGEVFRSGSCLPPEERVKATYRDNFERLVRVKNEYDPTNLFRVNRT